MPKQRAPYQRDNWYIGFQLGGGDATVRLRDRDASFVKPAAQGGNYKLRRFLGGSPTTFDADFQIGATITPRLLLGGQLSVFSAQATYDTPTGEVTNTFGVVGLNALATFFPWERGLFLRGGLGLASATATFEKVPPYGKVKEKGSGVGFTAGLGWAWWLGKSFNLSANLDFSGQGYGGDYFKGSSVVNLGLGFMWY
jgi:hypothetical protein